MIEQPDHKEEHAVPLGLRTQCHVAKAGTRHPHPHYTQVFVKLFMGSVMHMIRVHFLIIEGTLCVVEDSYASQRQMCRKFQDVFEMSS